MLNQINRDWKDIPWDCALRDATPAVAAALEKALAGSDLGFEEGLVLATVEGQDLVALVKVADELRRQEVGDCIYLRGESQLNFTNRLHCGVRILWIQSQAADAPMDAYFHSITTH